MMSGTNSLTLQISAPIILICLLGSIQKINAGVASNCFYNNELNYVYTLYDYSGNFSNVKEYEIKKGVECDFIVDVASKVTWWSDEQITAEVQIYHDRPENQYGCQSNSSDRLPYKPDTTINIGEEYDQVCMVKYYLHNQNKEQSLRLQIYKDGDAATYFKTATLMVVSIATLFASALV